MRVALIDNYDSFTFNVVHALGREGAKVEVFRNDAMPAEELLALKPDALVVSPGPCTPNEAGISLDAIRLAAGKVPLFGICLGHQAIGQVFGGRVVRATPMHGKLSRISHDGKGLFRGINGPLEVTRYHSLVVEAASLPETLLATARDADGLVMALQHRAMPVYGVQFHPESIATEQGQQICRNFLVLAREFNACTRAA
ncbi:anthranilate synthase component II [Rhabdaerophilum calidifontis]|uniref:anthranilate synthase component II n=1 Tax=Rhabdaerophilum calidifontis TaxID=2604328 RepID=UPI00123A0B0B|nr:aminodeoxychorismate/anthranilate synthase component II [Rhabdaerophilum calidifontis]